MLTAAIRDLHHWYPGQFLTDVRTACSDIWDNNPYLTPLLESDPEVEVFDCRYPLINHSNETPYHCLHGFIDFLNNKLGLSIRPTAFKGDIHLSAVERLWFSQVHEITGEDTPFWIVAAGGKYDVPIKWWDRKRYQEVIDSFKGKIQFVQVGQNGHHHPKLNGVLDFRGKTSLRQLIRLVYHSQGVLCSVTSLMHFAAAVETKKNRPRIRPCVVVAGAREPAHWEAYPDHQYIHTNGAVACGAQGGCWKSRIVPLRDGDKRDGKIYLCVNQVGSLPRCMDLITSAEVIRRIELYFQGHHLKYLRPSTWRKAEAGRVPAVKNNFDDRPLNIHSAGIASDCAIEAIPPCPVFPQERGIVICGGGIKYFICAWVCVRMLRRLGCILPIQIWHLGRKEISRSMEAMLSPYGVQFVDAHKVRKKIPVRSLSGWELKSYAILHSPFNRVLLLDADNVAVKNPEFLFSSQEFQQDGAIFWPDYPANGENAKKIWKSFGLRRPNEPEFESGQILVDKRRCWRALSLALWINENSDFYYQNLYGDKETFHIAFRKLKTRYRLVPKPIHKLKGTMCQHDFGGERIFQHRNTLKWQLVGENERVEGFCFENECLGYLEELRKLWNGRIV